MELNWLPISIRKGITTPRMFLLDDERFGGYYSHQTRQRCIHPDMDIDMSEGPAIVLCLSRDANTIAHEYRHHWQVECGRHSTGSEWIMLPGESYQQSITRYFRSYWFELDALVFELKYAPCDINMQWWEWVSV